MNSTAGDERLGSPKVDGGALRFDRLSAAEPLHIQADVRSAINAATHQNDVGVILKLAIINDGDVPAEELTLRLETQPPFARIWTRRIERIGSGEEVAVANVDLSLDPAYLLGLREAVRGEIRFILEDSAGQALAERALPVRLLAPAEWGGAGAGEELLAAFVQPNDPAVADLLKRAASALGQHGRNPALDGYQSGRRGRAFELAAGLWSAVAAWRLDYAVPPASFEETGQKVRLPSILREQRLATCLDTTLLFASALEAAGLNPFVVMKNGHSLAGVWLHDARFSDVVERDVVEVRKRRDLKEVVLFETTRVTGRTATFQTAVDEGARAIDGDGEADFLFALDVGQARRRMIRPLSLETGSTAPAPPPPEGETDLPLPPESGDLDLEDAGPELVPTTPLARLERWQRKLLDLSKRNRLLNFKGVRGEVPRSAVPFLVPDIATLEDRLAAGAKLKLRPIPDIEREAGRDPALHESRTGEEFARAFAKEAIGRDELVSPLKAEDLEKRLIGLYRTARNDLAEGGTNTLFLAVGFLAWKEKRAATRRYHAPLLLVPATLERKSVASGVRLTGHEDETRLNLTLLQMLRQDFGLSLGSLETTLPADSHGVDVAAVLGQVRHAVRDVPGFEVVEEVALGTFSFAKYLMWKDLVDRTADLKRSPLVRHLMETPREPYRGDEGKPPFPEPRRLDEEFQPAEILAPLPLDASQLSAVMAAARGRDFVLIGPPGTGKSQTIANMIAHAIGTGRTVLFVAEKAAALDVVHRRLVGEGLGSACLDLHSAKARKLEVLRQLGEAWTARAAGDGAFAATAGRFAERRRGLNRLVERLHRVYPNGLTPFDAFGRTLADDTPPVPLAFSGDAEAHDRAALQRMRDAVETLARRTGAVAGVDPGPLARLAPAEWSPAFEDGLIAAANGLSEAASALVKAGEIGERIGASPAARLDREGFTALAALLGAIAAAVAAGVETTLYDRDPATLRKRAALGSDAIGRIAGARSRLAADYPDEARRHLPLDVMKAALDKASLAFILFGWLARRRLRRMLATQAASGTPDPVRDIPALLDLATAEGDLTRSGLAEAVPDLVSTGDGDGERVSVRLGALDGLRAAIDAAPGEREPIERSARLMLDPSRRSLAAPLAKLAGELRARLASYGDAAFAFEIQAGAPASAAGPDDIAGALAVGADLAERRRHLRDWMAFLVARSAADGVGLGALVGALDARTIGPDALRVAFEAAYARWWSRAVVNADPALRQFSATDQDALIRDFRRLDTEIRRLSRAEIARRVAERRPGVDTLQRSSELGVLKRELEKKRAHLPVRELFQKMPQTLTRLTPCMMMSPLSVAQFLPAGQAPFDLVIFDEASQITTWDAVGALARGRQAVIVGDPKQLPPTAFFGRRDDADDSDAGAVEQHYERDLESILDEALGASVPERLLNVHYRSRAESLIAFSNHRYYGGRLITFPSVETPDRGVRLVEVAGALYDRGKSRTNRGEADAVVAEAVRRMHGWLRLAPDKRPTLGIVTFNSTQQELIENLLDRARRVDPALEFFFSEERIEPTIVKNLENVQGDERDVMLFSVTYGPDAAGKFPMNFGPLNADGGPRRLNVAVTRARRELVVFCSFASDRIDLRRTKSLGVADLKLYLEFARRGMAALAAETVLTGSDPDSPFEVAVADALRRRGWQVVPQVGASGYRIDIGVVHPDRPGRFLAGIECDGAQYHSAATARDRDILRQSILEGLGWTIFRVWSTDWWHDREREAARLDQAMCTIATRDREERERERSSEGEVAIEPSDMQVPDSGPSDDGAAGRHEPGDASPADDHTPETFAPPRTEEQGDTSPGMAETDQAAYTPERAPSPVTRVDDGPTGLVPETAGPVFREAGLSAFKIDPERFHAHFYAEEVLRPMVEAIVAAEGPIRDEVLVRRVARAHGWRRSGALIRDRVLLHARHLTLLEEAAGTFFVASGEARSIVPWRVAAPGEQPRALGDVSVAEIAGLAELHPTLRAVEDPARQLAEILGLERLFPSTRARLEEALRRAFRSA